MLISLFIGVPENIGFRIEIFDRAIGENRHLCRSMGSIGELCSNPACALNPMNTVPPPNGFGQVVELKILSSDYHVSLGTV